MIVHILSLNDDDDDAKALPTGVLKDDAMKKGGWGGQNVSKSDGVILVCSLRRDRKMRSIENQHHPGNRHLSPEKQHTHRQILQVNCKICFFHFGMIITLCLGFH